MIHPIILSHSPSRLARELQLHSARPDSRRSMRGDRYVINWGVSTYPTNWRQRSITFSNPPEAILNAVDKAHCLHLLRVAGVPTLQYAVGYTHAEVNSVDNGVHRWLEEDGKIVVRHQLNGHSGAGIQIVRTGEEIPAAPLYTRYFKKQKEYRIHVAFGNVILVQEKKKNDRFSEDNPLHLLVRTNGNGWTFCINDLSCDRYGYRQRLVDIATSAVRALGLGHGAVDILVSTNANKTLKEAVVCEVNTAPALRNPSTLEAWVRALGAKLQSLNTN